MKNIIFIVGTRPNFMKLAPVYNALNKNPTTYNLSIIHTGQHYDYNMSDIFFKQLHLPQNIINLNVNNNTPNAQLAEIMIKLEVQFTLLKPHFVVVFGDVTSTLAGALTANKMNIPLVHIESGNRSFDKTMPEEINRILVDQMTNYYFISEPNGINNLLNERLITYEEENKKWFYVGNPMIDTLLTFIDVANETLYYKSLDLTKNNYILITLHRQSNVDDDDNLQKIINIINLLAERYMIVMPVHPRKRSKIVALLKPVETIKIIDPLGYIEFINLLANCGLIMTDSGGVQEESTVLGIPCITLRPNTERPITCSHGTNTLYNICDDSSNGNNQLISLVDSKYQQYKLNETNNILYWDGKSGERIVDIFDNII